MYNIYYFYNFFSFLCNLPFFSCKFSFYSLSSIYNDVDDDYHLI